MKNQKLIYILLLLVPLFWGAGFSANKHALTEIPPATLCAVRFSIAAVLMVFWTGWKKSWNFDLIRKNFSSLAAMGLIGIAGFHVLVAIGTMYSTAISVSLIIAATPSITALLAILFFGETCTKQTVLGIVLSILGALLAMSQGGNSGGSSALLKMSFGFGELCLVLAVFCWAGYTLLVKNVVGKKSMDSTLVTTAATILGSIMLIFASVIMDSSWLKSFRADSISTQTGWEIIFLSVFSIFIAFILYSWGIKHIGATKASAYSNLTPINAVWIAVFLYGETVSTSQLIGMIATITGVILTNTSRVKT